MEKNKQGLLKNKIPLLLDWKDAGGLKNKLSSWLKHMNHSVRRKLQEKQE